MAPRRPGSEADPALGPSGTQRVGASPAANLVSADTVLAPSAPGRGAEGLAVVPAERYGLVREVARGGMGRVLEVLDRRLGRTAALKELLPGSPGDEERFVREALLTAKLEHPSIVPVHEAGRWPSGEPFYVMKLVRGRPLDRLIEDAPDLPRRLALLPHVLAVAEAIAYAHGQRVIHRDLKPQNVLVGDYGETVVVDWGLAKHLDEVASDGQDGPSRAAPSASESPGAPLTLAGSVMGTPAYMPPEQALGREVDERADVYALGAILYHVLAGQPPYEGASPHAVLTAVAARAPEPLSARSSAIPPDLEAVVAKSMAREPAARYATALELAHDLRRFQTGQLVGAHAYSPAQLARRFVHRHRLPLAVAAAALLAIATLAVLGVQRIRAERDAAEAQRAEAEAARAEAERARGDAQDRTDALLLVQARTLREQDPTRAVGWLSGLSPRFSDWGSARVIAADCLARGVYRQLAGHTAGVNEVVPDPAGARLFAIGDDGQLSVWNLATGAGRFFPAHEGEIWSLAVAPDGARLATGGKERGLHLFDTRTFERRVLAADPDRIWEMAFVDGGRGLVARTPGDAVRLFDVDAGTSESLGPASKRESGLAADAEGRRVAFASEGRVLLRDLRAGQTRPLGGLPGGIYTLAFSSRGDLVAAGGFDGTTTVFSLTGAPPRVLVGHRGGVHVAFSPDGTRLATGGEEGLIQLWEPGAGASRELTGHHGPIRVLRFSPDGRRLASGSGDHTVRLWDLERRTHRVLRGFVDTIPTLAFISEGRQLAAGSWDHQIDLFDVERVDGSVAAEHEGAVSGLVFAGACLWSAGADGRLTRAAPPSGAGPSGCVPSVPPVGGAPLLSLVRLGERVASASADGAVRITSASGEVRVLGSHAGRVAALAASPDGRWLVSGGEDGLVRLWDVEAGTAVEVGRHDAPVTAVATWGGEAVLSATKSGVVSLWQRAAGGSTTLLAARRPAVALAFSDDGRFLVAGDDHTLHAFPRGSATSVTLPIPGEIRRVAFLPGSSRLLLAAREDAPIRLIDAETGRVERVFRGPATETLELAISPEDKRFASASGDGTTWVWDLASGEGRRLEGFGAPASAVSFSPDGGLLATGYEDGSVTLWLDDLPLEAAALRSRFEGIAPRRAP